jgi:hypothetical protein
VNEQWYEKMIAHLGRMARDMKFRSGAALEYACAMELRETLRKELAEMRRLGLTTWETVV